MSKIFRFSGYLVIRKNYPRRYIDDSFRMIACRRDEKMQQLHVEESEPFEIDGEFDDNCDLALLKRHFKKHTSMEFDRPIPQTGEKYRHFKLGKIVEVIGISRHTETEEVSVVYRCGDTIWNRPLEMFMSEVDRNKYPDAKQKYRFERVEE